MTGTIPTVPIWQGCQTLQEKRKKLPIPGCFGCGVIPLAPRLPLVVFLYRHYRTGQPGIGNFFGQALESSRERLISLLDDWNYPYSPNLAGLSDVAREIDALLVKSLGNI
jgi:hypothetical protein